MSRRRATLMIALVVLAALVCAYALHHLSSGRLPSHSPTATVTGDWGGLG